MINTENIPCCLWRHVLRKAAISSTFQHTCCVSCWLRNSTALHHCLTNTLIYQRKKRLTMKLKINWVQWWMLHTTPWNNPLLSGNWRGIVHGGVLATPGCWSARQFSWMCQNGFAISKISQKGLYYSFLDKQPEKMIETIHTMHRITPRSTALFAIMVCFPHQHYSAFLLQFIYLNLPHLFEFDTFENI